MPMSKETEQYYLMVCFSGWPGTHCIGSAGLEIRELSDSAFEVSGVEDMSHHSQPMVFLGRFKCLFYVCVMCTECHSACVEDKPGELVFPPLL